MADHATLEWRYRVFGILAEVSAVVLIVGLGIELVCVIVDEKDKFWSVLANIFVFGGVGGEVLFAHISSTAADALLTGQRKQIAEANERVAEIQRVTGSRHLSAEEADQLVAALDNKASEYDVVVEFQTSDPEAYSYAREIMLVLADAGVEKIRFRDSLNKLSIERLC
ncbi:MAG: hypothetical protein J0J01_00035 [Reyranella sp.]|uniref:hypothetical protein n=1 Tax=Reyranella sp. TaxID=1929291 RepID=UPI001AD40A3E|nr:hypothetical protein [Reyranella sp.]MBN9085265.1 hypothetical protein [Reyranella sp.]